MSEGFLRWSRHPESRTMRRYGKCCVNHTAFCERFLHAECTIEDKCCVNNTAFCERFLHAECTIEDKCCVNNTAFCERFLHAECIAEDKDVQRTTELDVHLFWRPCVLRKVGFQTGRSRLSGTFTNENQCVRAWSPGRDQFPVRKREDGRWK